MIIEPFRHDCGQKQRKWERERKQERRIMEPLYAPQLSLSMVHPWGRSVSFHSKPQDWAVKIASTDYFMIPEHNRIFFKDDLAFNIFASRLF